MPDSTHTGKWSIQYRRFSTCPRMSSTNHGSTSGSWSSAVSSHRNIRSSRSSRSRSVARRIVMSSGGVVCRQMACCL